MSTSHVYGFHETPNDEEGTDEDWEDFSKDQDQDAEDYR